MSIRSKAIRLTEMLTQHGLVLIYHQVGRESPDPLHVGVSEDMPREDAFLLLHSSLRALPPEKIEAALERIRRQAGISPAVPRADVRPLTWKECAKVAASGWIAVGAHTLRHAWLAAMPEAAQKSEMEDSRRMLEERLDLKVRAFAYPYGDNESETTATLRAARESGFAYAYTNVKAAVYVGSDGYWIQQTAVQGGSDKIGIPQPAAHGGSDRYWIPRITPGGEGGAEFSRRLEEHMQSAHIPARRRDMPVRK